MDSIQANNLVKNFGDFRAVDQISFNVKKGETFSILGENGAGKSTTMRMIACRSPFTSGSLFVEGLDVKEDERKIRSLIGIVPQENNLDPDLNVRENLLVYAKYFRIPKSVAIERCDELLDFIKLNEKKNSKVEALSGGMKRRLIIARSLLHRPRILLLDEPTTGLDPNVRQEIWEKLEELRRRDNITIVLSTHYMDEAEKLSQRLIVMANGKIIARGNPQDLILEKVKRFALEIREAENFPFQNLNSNILSIKRGTTRLFYADNTESLTSIMQNYDSTPKLLRPSNLEDVFLSISKF